MRLRSAILIFAFQVGGTCQPAPPSRPLTLCDVFADLQKFAGKAIIIKDRFESGMEQFMITDPRCKNAFVTNGLKWPVAVQLVIPAAEERGSLPFEPVWASIANFLDRIRKRTQSDRYAAGCAVFTGLLQTRDDYKVQIGSSGVKKGLGFGHMSALPARLVIMQITDIEFETGGTSPTCRAQ